MKKVVLKHRPVGVPSGQLETIPAPQPLPPPEPAPAEDTAAAIGAMAAAALPPPPVEVEEAPPTDFEGWMRWAIRARPPRGQLQFSQFFASLAQAYATKELADELATLNEFLGAHDEAEDEDGDENGKPREAAPVRLADQITEGILNAVASLNLEHLLANAQNKA